MFVIMNSLLVVKLSEAADCLVELGYEVLILQINSLRQLHLQEGHQVILLAVVRSCCPKKHASRGVAAQVRHGMKVCRTQYKS